MEIPIPFGAPDEFGPPMKKPPKPIQPSGAVMVKAIGSP